MEFVFFTKVSGGGGAVIGRDSCSFVVLMKRVTFPLPPVNGPVSSAWWELEWVQNRFEAFKNCVSVKIRNQSPWHIDSNFEKKKRKQRLCSGICPQETGDRRW